MGDTTVVLTSVSDLIGVGVKGNIAVWKVFGKPLNAPGAMDLVVGAENSLLSPPVGKVKNSGLLPRRFLLAAQSTCTLC